jgi:hypothetical protein
MWLVVLRQGCGSWAESRGLTRGWGRDQAPAEEETGDSRGAGWAPTDLQHVLHGAAVQQTNAPAERQPLTAAAAADRASPGTQAGGRPGRDNPGDRAGRRSGAGGWRRPLLGRRNPHGASRRARAGAATVLEAGVHADLPLIPREGPVDDAALHRLRDPLEALLHPLVCPLFRHRLSGAVQQGLRLQVEAGPGGQAAAADAPHPSAGRPRRTARVVSLWAGPWAQPLCRRDRRRREQLLSLTSFRHCWGLTDWGGGGCSGYRGDPGHGHAPRASAQRRRRGRGRGGEAGQTSPRTRRPEWGAWAGPVHARHQSRRVWPEDELSRGGARCLGRRGREETRERARSRHERPKRAPNAPAAGSQRVPELQAPQRCLVYLPPGLRGRHCVAKWNDSAASHPREVTGSRAQGKKNHKSGSCSRWTRQDTVTAEKRIRQKDARKEDGRKKTRKFQCCKLFSRHHHVGNVGVPVPPLGNGILLNHCSSFRTMGRQDPAALQHPRGALWIV